MMHSSDPLSPGAKIACAALTTVDLIQYVASFPDRGTKTTPLSTHIDIGGPAANAAVTVALLGGAVSLVTVLGEGILADLARDVLASRGVAVVEQSADAGVPAATIWVEAATGERTIVAEVNAAASVDAGSGFVSSGTVAVLLDGHYAPLTRTIAREAAAAEVPIVLDCGRWRSSYEELLPPATDVIATTSFRPRGLESARAEEAVVEMSGRWQLELCALTRGGESIVAAVAGDVAEIPVPSVDAVDTTGAGDVLHGAYVYYRYIEGWGPLAALSEAAIVASESCRYRGARAGVEAYAEARGRGSGP